MKQIILSILFLSFILFQCAGKPNILFIIDESTDGRAYFIGRENIAPMQLPSLQSIYKNGVAFNTTYVVAPVCCPSRSAIWSGRHIHKIPHMQENPATGLKVGGSWNNHEGLPLDYTNKISDILEQNGYNVGIFGKTDWSAGGHSLDCRVTAWTNKANFPYTLKNGSYGWYDEGGPVNITATGNKTHIGDWDNTAKLQKWMIEANKEEKPFFGYIGYNIVHPDYISSPYWLDKVNTSRITIPKWKEISEMHPEDFQSSMKKKMGSTDCCSDEKKRTIRHYYYAMIREYDAMVGELLSTLDQLGIRDNTYVIAMADHGDMNMEHRQYYKMVFYDASSRVPLLISGPGVMEGVVIEDVVSSVDLFPTILEMANVPPPSGVNLDGYSLMPYLKGGKDESRPPYIMSQFHGDEIHLSWFMLRNYDYKYVVYGSGKEVAPRLFNIREDPEEMDDLASKNPEIVEKMDATLRTIIDYPSVASEVERYNKDSFSLWRSSLKDEDTYKAIMRSIRWKHSWAYDDTGSFQAIENWLKTPNVTFDWSY